MAEFSVVQCPFCLAVNIAWIGDPPGDRRNRCAGHALSGDPGDGSTYHYRFPDSWRLPKRSARSCMFPLTDASGALIPHLSLAEYLAITRGPFDPDSLADLILTRANVSRELFRPVG